MRYRNYDITYDPKPIPDRSCDYNFCADGYDGAPDSGDRRCGTAPSIEAAKVAIDELEEELYDSAERPERPSR